MIAKFEKEKEDHEKILQAAVDTELEQYKASVQAETDAHIKRLKTMYQLPSSVKAIQPKTSDKKQQANQEEFQKKMTSLKETLLKEREEAINKVKARIQKSAEARKREERQKELDRLQAIQEAALECQKRQSLLRSQINLENQKVQVMLENRDRAAKEVLDHLLEKIYASEQRAQFRRAEQDILEKSFETIAHLQEQMADVQEYRSKILQMEKESEQEQSQKTLEAMKSGNEELKKDLEAIHSEHDGKIENLSTEISSAEQSFNDLSDHVTIELANETLDEKRKEDITEEAKKQVAEEFEVPKHEAKKFTAKQIKEMQHMLDTITSYKLYEFFNCKRFAFLVKLVVA